MCNLGPLDSADGVLPPYNLDLPPERQHLSLELGLVASARGHRVEQDS
jgi:hypothetical protein